MTDQYLTWLEDKITEVSNAQQIYISMPKMSRDLEKIFETLETCKSKYIECHQKDKSS